MGGCTELFGGVLPVNDAEVAVTLDDRVFQWLSQDLLWEDEEADLEDPVVAADIVRRFNLRRKLGLSAEQRRHLVERLIASIQELSGA